MQTSKALTSTSEPEQARLDGADLSESDPVHQSPGRSLRGSDYATTAHRHRPAQSGPDRGATGSHSPGPATGMEPARSTKVREATPDFQYGVDAAWDDAGLNNCSTLRSKRIQTNH